MERVSLKELLTEREIGLVFSDSGNQVGWFETSTREIDADFKGNDFDCFGFTDADGCNALFFNCDATVNPIGDFLVEVCDINGLAHQFTMFKMVPTKEVFR